jgi:hypothetical protein
MPNGDSSSSVFNKCKYKIEEFLGHPLRLVQTPLGAGRNRGAARHSHGVGARGCVPVLKLRTFRLINPVVVSAAMCAKAFNCSDKWIHVRSALR